jgi:kinesin family protein 3/17
MSSSESIKVVVRCRPLNSREKEDGRLKIVEMDRKTGQVILNNPKGDNSEPPKQFTFDSVMDESITQKEVYELSARPIVANVIEGYNGTVFAYGQTGTGKTHTMVRHAQIACGSVSCSRSQIRSHIMCPCKKNRCWQD